MKRIVALIITLCLLAGFTLAGAESLHFEGKPWINSNFYGIWPSERPAAEDTFELYANYDLYQKALADGDRREYSLIGDADKQIAQRLLSMYTDESLTGPETEFIRTLYSMYKDTEKRTQEGLEPLKSHAEKLRAVKSLEELTALIQEEGWLYGSALYTHSLETNNREYGVYYLEFNAESVIPDMPQDSESYDIPEKDVGWAKEALRCMGWTEGEASEAVDKLMAAYDISTVIEFETDLENELMTRGSGLITLNEIRQVCPQLCEMLIAQGLTREGTEDVQMYRFQINDLIRIKNCWKEKNLEMLKAALALGMYKEVEIILPKDAADDTGNPDAALDRMMPRTVVEQGYVCNFVPQERIDLYNELAAEYKEAMRARIERNEWLSEESKKEACRKLDQLVASELLYPYGKIDCSSLPEKLHACANMLEANGLCVLFRQQCEAHFAGREWLGANRFGTYNSTLKAEGHYELEENVFYMGVGALSEITLDTTSRETILGTLGHHIGHELSHGFDTLGSQYNADRTGSLFTETDQQKFIEKVRAIALQVCGIEVMDGVYSNGELQIGEVLADLTGMSLTLDLAKKTENFDYDTFFRAFARFFSYYHASREETGAETVTNDIHPYCYLRVNFTVQHFDEFYQTYPSVKEGTPMYLAPENRILVW